MRWHGRRRVQKARQSIGTIFLPSAYWFYFPGNRKEKKSPKLEEEIATPVGRLELIQPNDKLVQPNDKVALTSTTTISSPSTSSMVPINSPGAPKTGSFSSSQGIIHKWCPIVGVRGGSKTTLNNRKLDTSGGERVKNDLKNWISFMNVPQRGNLIAKQTRFAIWFLHIGKKGQNLVQKLILYIIGIKRNTFVCTVC